MLPLLLLFTLQGTGGGFLPFEASDNTEPLILTGALRYYPATAVSVPDFDGDGIRELVNVRLEDIDPFFSSAHTLLVYASLSKGGQLTYGGLSGAFSLTGTFVLKTLENPSSGLDAVMVGYGTSLNSGTAYVFRAGLSPFVLAYQAGMNFAMGSDLDGDGVKDIVVGFPLSSPGGITSAGGIRAYSGSDFHELFSVQGGLPFEYLGQFLKMVPDYNGDGVDEILSVSQIDSYHSGPTDRNIQIHLGTNGALYTYGATSLSEPIWPVPPETGDLNGDGIDDFMIPLESGSLRFMDGTNLNTIFSDLPFPISSSGLPMMPSDIQAVGDLDGDGVEDVMMRFGSLLKVFPTSTGQYSYEYAFDRELVSSVNGYDEVRRGVAPFGDWDGDGREDLVVLAEISSLEHEYWHIGWKPFLSTESTSLSASSLNLVGFDVDFPSVKEDRSGWDYRLLMSLSTTGSNIFGLDIPLGMSAELISSWFGDFNPYLPYAAGASGQLNQFGRAFPTLGALSMNSSMIGLTLNFCVVAGPHGSSPEMTSVAVPLIIQP